MISVPKICQERPPAYEFPSKYLVKQALAFPCFPAYAYKKPKFNKIYDFFFLEATFKANFRYFSFSSVY